MPLIEIATLDDPSGWRCCSAVKGTGSKARSSNAAIAG